MFLLVKRSCFKCISKDNEENSHHGKRQLGTLLNKLTNSKGVSIVSGAGHAGKVGWIVGGSAISVVCQRQALAWDIPATKLLLTVLRC